MAYQRRSERKSDRDNNQSNSGLAPLNSNPPFVRQRKKPNSRLDGLEYIDYKNTDLLEKFLNDQGKLLPRRITGANAKQQRQLTVAVKRARHLALLPFVADNLS